MRVISCLLLILFAVTRATDIPDEADLYFFLSELTTESTFVLTGSNYSISEGIEINVNVKLLANSGVTPTIYCSRNFTGLKTTGNLFMVEGVAFSGCGIVVESNSANISISNSNFENNNFAIKAFNFSSGTISSSFFSNNSRGLDFAFSSFSILSSSFTSNLNNAIYSSNSKIIIKQSIFNGNNATQGGAIYSIASNLEISYSNFNSNNAIVSHGGAISGSKYNGSISFSNFTNNFATRTGGSIYGDTCIFGLLSSVFIFNYARADGGAIAFYSSNITINDSVVNYNTIPKDSGGGISAENSFLWIYNSVFSHNRAGLSGGGIALRGNIFNWCVVEMRGVETTNNTAKRGGGLELWTMLYTLDNITVIGNNATGISKDSDILAGTGGGILFASSSFGLTTNSRILNNLADYGGGSSFGSKTNFSRTEFTGNTAKRDGGAIYLGTSGASMVMHDCTIANNSAINGGGLYITDSVVVRTVITRNYASNRGGGVYASTNLIYACQIFDNEALIGGGLYQSGGGVEIVFTNISNNRALTSGGGVVLSVSSGYNTILINNTISGNVAVDNTGLLMLSSRVYVRNNVIETHFSNKTFCCEGTVLSNTNNQMCNFPVCSTNCSTDSACDCPFRTTEPVNPDRYIIFSVDTTCYSCKPSFSKPPKCDVADLCYFCSPNATCVLNRTKCECNDGFTGNGYSCSPSTESTTSTTELSLTSSTTSNTTYSTSTSSSTTGDSTTGSTTSSPYSTSTGDATSSSVSSTTTNGDSSKGGISKGGVVAISVVLGSVALVAIAFGIFRFLQHGRKQKMQEYKSVN